MSATAPRRIHRSRAKGARLPENTICVDRSTKWGNPFIVNPHVSAGSKSGGIYICVPTIEDALACYREYIAEKAELQAALHELRGHDLACWCALDQPCHADVLLELANAAPAPQPQITDDASPAKQTGIVQ